MSSKISGICHICGKETELTFEHLPPRKANNNNRAKAIVGDELTKYIAGNDRPWDFSSCKYKDTFYKYIISIRHYYIINDYHRTKNKQKCKHSFIHAHCRSYCYHRKHHINYIF